MHPILLAALLLGTPETAGAASLEHLVRCDSIRGLPRDTAQSRQFMDGFREAFDQGEIAIESNGAEGWKKAAPFPNRFRSFEGAYARELWTLQVFVRVPQTSSGAWQGHMELQNHGGGTVGVYVPPSFGSIVSKKRYSRGMIIAALAEAPSERDAGVSATPVQAAIAFPRPTPPPESEGAMVLPPMGGYDFPWRDAGRAAALVALEALHRRSGDLKADQRMLVAPALRVEQEP